MIAKQKKEGTYLTKKQRLQAQEASRKLLQNKGGKKSFLKFIISLLPFLFLKFYIKNKNFFVNYSLKLIFNNGAYEPNF